jgi:hypothetical protein
MASPHLSYYIHMVLPLINWMQLMKILFNYFYNIFDLFINGYYRNFTQKAAGDFFERTKCKINFQKWLTSKIIYFTSNSFI